MRAVGDGLDDGVVRRHLHLLRVAHELHRQRLDPGLERGREQQRLALLRHPVDDALDRRQEAHVEHAVGFVEHQYLVRVELGAAALEVVDQAAGGGDEDVDAAAQVVDLRAHAGTTEDGGDVQAQVAAVGLDAVGDLHRELARGHQSEEHKSELQSLMRISYAVFCLNKKKNKNKIMLHIKI